MCRPNGRIATYAARIQDVRGQNAGSTGGINAKVSKDQWESTGKAVLEQTAKGSLKAGLSAGIKSAANVLEEHFPWTEGDRNEIPDRIIVRRE